MLRQIYIDKFNKVVTSFKAQLFSSLTVLQAKPYNKEVEVYDVRDQHQQHYLLYTSNSPLEPVLEEIPFIEAAPKILLFNSEKTHIILEESIGEQLYEYLLSSEEHQSHYLEAGEEKEGIAKKVLGGLRHSLLNYLKHNIDYNAINPRNIVRRHLDWELSLVGLLLKNEKESEDYYKQGVQLECRHTYALGTLLFKILFGFVPFEKKRELKKFSFKTYHQHLDKEELKKLLKVYSYADGMLEASIPAKQLIEESLTGRMSLEEFYSHRFFEQGSLLRARKEMSSGAREIKMLSLFEQSSQSLILASIQHRKRYPQERLNSKLVHAHQLTKEETIQHMSRHPVLFELQFDGLFRNEKDKGQVRPEESVPLFNVPYFYREEEFDSELDLPCRDLMKFISNSVGRKQLGEVEGRELEETLKVYAYPYTVVFELAKVSQMQSPDIQRKIRRLSEDLLQVSRLNFPRDVMPLHDTQCMVKSFEEVKVRFRELLNEVYRHFLNEAIRKYNVKRELVSVEERASCKSQGLEYYKLCLKLMECSVLNRKKGKDLDLQRIETSTRKEIEADLNQLLQQYFPTKINHF